MRIIYALKQPFLQNRTLFDHDHRMTSLHTLYSAEAVEQTYEYFVVFLIQNYFIAVMIYHHGIPYIAEKC